MSGVRLSPIIVLVDDETLSELRSLEPVVPPAAFVETLERNGWTMDMLIGGNILRAALTGDPQ